MILDHGMVVFKVPKVICVAVLSYFKFVSWLAVLVATYSICNPENNTIMLIG